MNIIFNNNNNNINIIILILRLIMFFWHDINNNLAHRLHLNKTSFFSVVKYRGLWNKYKKMFYLFTIIMVYLYFIYLP